VKGTEQGDLLEVELVAVEAATWEQWGYTVEVPGFGFLRDEFPDPYIVHWRLHGATSTRSPNSFRVSVFALILTLASWD
jgi:formamidase